MGTMEVKFETEQTLDKTVHISGGSGRVLIPKSWVGKKVRVCLLEKLDVKTEL
jgi:putative transposon-encoded protein